MSEIRSTAQSRGSASLGLTFRVSDARAERVSVDLHAQSTTTAKQQKQQHEERPPLHPTADARRENHPPGPLHGFWPAFKRLPRGWPDVSFSFIRSVCTGMREVATQSMLHALSCLPLRQNPCLSDCLEQRGLHLRSAAFCQGKLHYCRDASSNIVLLQSEFAWCHNACRLQWQVLESNKEDGSRTLKPNILNL